MTGAGNHGEDPIRPPLESAATLVVRTWLQNGSDGVPRLRGTVSELVSQRMLGAFDSLERLAALVEDHATGRPPTRILTTSEEDDD